MKMRTALEKHLLRVVPQNKEKTWFEPFKGKPIEDYKDHMGETMYLFNERKAFVFMKNAKELKGKTFLSHSGVAVLYVNNPDVKLPPHQAHRFKVIINDEFLDAEIANFSDASIKDAVMTFNAIGMRVLKGSALSDIEKSSLLQFPDTYKVFSVDALLAIEGVRGTDLEEIIRANMNSSLRPEGDKGRLLLWERAHNIRKPLTLELYHNSLLNKAITFQEQ